jgi:hypothetical protein
MRDFIRTGLQILLVINVIAWMFPAVEEMNNWRRLPVEAVVTGSQVVVDSYTTPQGGSGTAQRVQVKSAYVFAGVPYEFTQITSLLNGKPKPLGEIASYYSPGRKIVVWVDPGRPDEARFHKENTTYLLPFIFLALLLALFVAHMRSKND